MRLSTKFFFYGLLGLATSAIAVTGPQAMASGNGITVSVQGVKAIQGQVCYSLFSSAQGFPDSSSGAIRAQCLPVSNSSPAISFGNLNPGTYAVAVFHDVNGDGLLNKNGLGIPTEAFGFSKNPAIYSGPPKFSDAAIFVAGPQTSVQIQLKQF
jgi:uncharacterized protein (DUF2141 family)